MTTSRRLGLVALGLVAAIAVSLGVRLASARDHLEAARTQLDRAKRAVVQRDDPRADAALDRARRDLDAADRAASAFPAGTLSAIPLLGSPSKAAAAAVVAGREVVAAGAVLADAASAFPASGSSGLTGSDLAPFHAASLESVAALDRANVHLERAAAALDGPTGAMLPPVSKPAREMHGLVLDTEAQLAGARRGITLLGQLTATDANVRLLVLSQDSMELRATGGYTGSFGVLTFKAGTIELENYRSFEDLPPPNPPFKAPPALARAMRRPWDLSNSGWYPNFPTSAKTARDMFAAQGGGPVDGVVALTDLFLSRLVGVIGPVPVVGYEPVVEKGFQQRVLYEVELKRPLDVPRKKFLTLLADEVFKRVFALEGDDVPKVAKAIDAAVAAGDIQVWFGDPARQAMIDGTAWSGALPPPGDHDFLALVEDNLSASKANAELTRQIRYHVERDGSGRLVARLTIDYENAGEKSEVNPHYNGYLRIYTPKGSRLLTRKGPGNDGIAPDAPYQVFTRYVFVNPKESKTITIRWVLPVSVAPKSEYRLLWYRQPGTPNDRLTATAGGQRVSAEPPDRTIELEATLRRNRVTELFHR